MATPSLTIIRRIKAPRAKVYAAFTRAEHLAQWWGPDAGPVLHAEADVRVGGRYRIVFETLNGARHETLGVYREVEPDRRLVFTFQWVSYPDRQSLVTVHFDAAPDGTELTVLHEDFHDELVQRSHRDGWDGSLTKLQALLETSPERNANADA